MKRASITEAKNGFSALLERVKGGTSVLIMDRGRPVARLEPVLSEHSSDDQARLSRLVREGIVRPARTRLPKSLFTDPLPRPKNGASAVAALIEERREGR